jgi:hypothetical protein
LRRYEPLLLQNKSSRGFMSEPEHHSRTECTVDRQASGRSTWTFLHVRQGASRTDTSKSFHIVSGHDHRTLRYWTDHISMPPLSRVDDQKRGVGRYDHAAMHPSSSRTLPAGACFATSRQVVARKSKWPGQPSSGIRRASGMSGTTCKMVPLRLSVSYTTTTFG